MENLVTDQTVFFEANIGLIIFNLKKKKIQCEGQQYLFVLLATQPRESLKKINWINFWVEKVSMGVSTVKNNRYQDWAFLDWLEKVSTGVLTVDSSQD
jgi:hypothetical protein